MKKHKQKRLIKGGAVISSSKPLKPETPVQRIPPRAEIGQVFPRYWGLLGQPGWPVHTIPAEALRTDVNWLKTQRSKPPTTAPAKPDQ